MSDRAARREGRRDARRVGDCEIGPRLRADREHIVRRPTSWLDPRVLWAARNQVVTAIDDPVDAERRALVARARERALVQGRSPDFVMDESGRDGAVLVLGDPGEGDLSQYAVVPALEAAADGVAFGVICSDVIYPAGALHDYPDKFVRPYRHLAFPLWAVAGNHDWCDGLRGFLAAFCGVRDAPAKPARSAFRPGPRGSLARLLWRPARVTAHDLDRLDDLPPATRAARRPQPAPYFAIDTRHVRFVGIDTGISGRIDAEQEDWLRRVSFDSALPKVLLTGKPLWVDGALDDVTAPVARIVRDPAARYVAAIGGDTHNYQRYPLDLGDGRTLHAFVSGGGGAFMHDTHSIARVSVRDPDGRVLADERDVRFYPLRRDSMARYSEVADAYLGGRGLLRVTPDEAALYFVQKVGINALPADDGVDMGRRMPLRLRAKAAILSRLYAGPWFHRLLGPIVFDWDRPPVFKQFLRLEPSADGMVVRCLSADGCAGSDAGVEEDVVRIGWGRS